MISTKPINVVYTDRSPIFAGAEQCLTTLVQYLDRREVAPTICFDLPEKHQFRFGKADCTVAYREPRAPAWMLSRRFGRPIRGVGRLEQRILARRLGRFLVDVRADVLHVNLLRSASYWDLAIARKLGIRTIGHMRSLGSQVRIHDATLAMCDIVLCMSEKVKRDVDQWGRVNTKVIYDGVPDKECEYAGGRDAARHALGLPSDARILCSVAALEPRKGHDIAIEAHARLLSHDPELFLLIAGGPVTRATDDYPRLQSLVRKFGTENKVRFLGHVSNVPEVYGAADIVYGLSRDGEAFGRVAPEAAAARRAFVGTRVGATPEVVRHGETGILVEPNNIEEVVQWTKTLLGSCDLRDQLGENGHQFIHTQFSPHAHAKAVAELYQSIVKSETGCVA